MMKLYSYWRSSAAYRVRIALHYKGVDFAYEPVNLLEGQQKDAAYAAVNKLQLIPTLVTDDGAALTQSLAIIEYLNEIRPEPNLLPGDVIARARAHSIAAIFACETQPLQNMRVQNYLKTEMGHTQEEVSGWMNHWVGKSLASAEAIAQDFGGAYCVGDSVSLADVFLVPQIYSAQRFGVDVSPYGKLMDAYEQLCLLAPFKKAHPDNQPDAPRG